MIAADFIEWPPGFTTGFGRALAAFGSCPRFRLAVQAARAFMIVGSSCAFMPDRAPGTVAGPAPGLIQREKCAKGKDKCAKKATSVGRESRFRWSRWGADSQLPLASAWFEPVGHAAGGRNRPFESCGSSKTLLSIYSERRASSKVFVSSQLRFSGPARGKAASRVSLCDRACSVMCGD